MLLHSCNNKKPYLRSIFIVIASLSEAEFNKNSTDT